MRYGIKWFEGFGEHDFVEASSAEYGSLQELIAAMVSTASEEEVFRALVDGPQEYITWIRDDLGFQLVATDT